MAASTAATTLLPPVKNVVVYKNGDPFYSGRRFVVNQRHVATMEAFLTEVTQSIGAPLAVRTLYTPRQGHRVTDLQDLQTGAQYVAAGFERFKKLDYLNARLKKQPAAREETQAKVTQRPNVSAKWRKFIPVPCIIHVFRNGDLLCPPFRFILPRSMRQDLEQILSLVTEKVSLRTGAVRRLCSLEGATVSSAVELETGHCYVAVGTERFKKLPYVELLVSKATERHYPGKRRLLRRNENRKGGRGPEDQYSDSALLNSPESDGRRVKSTGDEAAAPPAARQRSRREEADETSAFFARPVKIRNNRGQPRPPLSNGSVQPSVFKRAARKRREEVRGAEDVHEDENTATELPVDQRVAEIVEDEDLCNQSNPLHNTQRHAQSIESEQQNRMEHPHKHDEQGLSFEQDGVKQTEEYAAKILEPELKQTSKSRPSSSTSQGRNKKEKEKRQDAPSITVEQNHHQQDW
ncbi:doublecortin domain-containing protein 2B isoform X1 [Etheostoma spectabile]|uniref:doublecortin domain-containing protein 2B isoform X1 n=1 Tax=Etheostoma spectabile TaxID=54343 RepID=UPI0013AFEA0F|nr:doublecortin domain-containing protein 2B isoform X1 [Etheostoma spectabile]XP_032356607.1 doublecortin domain-containing protein 2B isoform X1 [Etheostoma spectabile]